MKIVKTTVHSNFGLVPVVHFQLESGDKVNALDLRKVKNVRWLRSSSLNGCSFCLRSGDNPNLIDATIGYLSTNDLVNVSRHEGLLVFRDMRAATQDVHSGNDEGISCYILPQDIIFSWPLADIGDGEKVDDLVSKEHGGVFIPTTDCF